MMIIPTRRVGIYARVSTSDKDQDPATQLLPLREFVAAHGWKIAGEFVDHAPETDPRGPTAWTRLLDLAGRRKLDLVLVWRIDRVFRSVEDAAHTMERLRDLGVGLRSYHEPWLDTTSPFGEVLYNVSVAYARLERGTRPQRELAAGGAQNRKRLG
jgi:DNA invertase Pin-like site-specific DNA recombinase